MNNRRMAYCVVTALISVIAQCWQCCVSPSLRAQEAEIVKNVVIDGETAYMIRFTSGEMVVGVVVELVGSGKQESLIIKTRLGKALIAVADIAEMTLLGNLYRHNHRVYLMPTAEPIRGNHFVGAWQLLFLYGGFGVGNISLTGGLTLVPGLSGEEQGKLLNVKATVFSTEVDESGNRGTLALGGNLTFANSSNLIWNGYAAATFSGQRTSITALAFTKIGAPDTYTVRAGNFGQAFGLRYEAGAFGLGIGLDSRFTERQDLHVIAELWTPRLAQLSNTGLLAGLRLANTSVSMDFGLAVFPQPLVLPFVSFAWTPF